MATNEEINNGEIKRKYFELHGGWSDHVEAETIDDALNEARANTAKQIFADLRKIITLFPNNIGEIDIEVIFPKSDAYKSIEKKYGVD